MRSNFLPAVKSREDFEGVIRTQRPSSERFSIIPEWLVSSRVISASISTGILNVRSLAMALDPPFNFYTVIKTPHILTEFINALIISKSKGISKFSNPVRKNALIFLIP